MIPPYSRVVAIDDNEDHLKKIVWGLGKAGFCPIPFHFSDGKLENAPNVPLPGIRLVFTDIHMVGGAMSQPITHANNIMKCIRAIISNGPYVLVFWSQYPGDSETIKTIILERAASFGITPPIGFAAIDKNSVFKASELAATDEFDAEKLRELIINEISDYKTLAVATSWEDRASRAAARTTNRLFDLVKKSEIPAQDWEKLLAFLASEAVGNHNAKVDLTGALDAALLPLLEDQLYHIGDEPPPQSEDTKRLATLVNEVTDRPNGVAISLLNTSYLIEEISPTGNVHPSGRGIVSKLGPGFVNSGAFVNAFNCDANKLVRQEFATRDLTAEENNKVKLHMVELGAECDHAQGKISTQRYLMAVLIPLDLLGAFTSQMLGQRKPSTPRYRNESVLDIGCISLGGDPDNNWHLLISARCFMSLPAKAVVDCFPMIRIRRALLEEVAHRYTTYTRRPGVMRFKN